MRYHNITKDDMLNGDGLRVVLWVAGCEHRCPDCQNPVTWDINGGLEFDESGVQEIFEELNKNYISGVTLSGGDPLHKKNRADTGSFIERTAREFPDKTIWIYTGYEWQDVKDLPFMKYVDVLVDGPFIESQKDNRIPWRGSANQKVIDVKKSLEIGKTVLVMK
ncbi:MAG: anaerobic ribonucleoside-triphosphate reductase activating protein [Clostridia bacterium]|nr:anaerobic ribonucleoside-triphosphate reductase activating protein [Clostridia bacterium]MCI8979304.1 anaerobic ribonucleoside-triphosphate reductase activating protein [Clostridia bacterium]MCI9086229.1 anaerobic ribonucleoside-triphosphate reductase activating protein [Clostridia bacterium]